MTRQPDGSYQYQGTLISPKSIWDRGIGTARWVIDIGDDKPHLYFRTLRAAKAYIDKEKGTST